MFLPSRIKFTKCKLCLMFVLFLDGKFNDKFEFDSIENRLMGQRL